MNMETKKQVFERYKEEYFEAKAKKKGGRKRQGEILNIVCDVAGYARKAAVRKFGNLQTKDPLALDRRGRVVYYTADVTSALKDVWDASNGLCGELLHPLIAEYVNVFKRDNNWKNGDEATGKLLSISERTVKRRVSKFEKVKRKGQGFSSTSPSNIKNIIPVFMGPWRNADPGHEQIDTVAHCGSALKGDFIYTLNSVDVATLWNVSGAQWNKGAEATIQNRVHMRKRIPFPHIRDHSDTGSEFINYDTYDWSLENNLKLTRSRPNKKNDNCYIEERNGHVIRKYVGYIRLDCIEALDALSNLFEILNLYTNHFISSRKTIDNTRVGAKYRRTYGKALTPYQRVLEHPKIAEEVKEKLRLEHDKLNPAVLLKEVERLRSVLYDTQRKHGSRMY
jgi:hypothetical protein